MKGVRPEIFAALGKWTYDIEERLKERVDGQIWVAVGEPIEQGSLDNTFLEVLGMLARPE